MKRIFSGFCAALLALVFIIPSAGNCQKTVNNIIPKPVSYKPGKGNFILSNETRIVLSPSSKELAKVGAMLREAFPDFSLNISDIEQGDRIPENSIFLSLNSALNTGSEGYKLEITEDGIKLEAVTGKGVFYGLQTLFQLLPSSKYRYDNPEIKIKSCYITDYPRFSYRGMHLDVCRHMFPVDFIKKYIDLLAMYKINNFHWHLTEDQGWRIEIRKYPLLTEVGAYRASTPIGRNTGDDHQHYGGFYTQEEARDIVRYAAERYVNVIPEIEMPGHALAALAAYPNLSCTGGPFEVWTKWGVTEDIYCAGNEQVFSFLEDVLTEVMEIFPSKYIHIGGDEAPKTRWDNCRLCQERMQKEGLKDAHELQNYFITRIEKFLNANGRQIIGWDEILEGGLAPGATVMSWRGTEGGIQAAGMKHDVIMTPGKPCYFDHYQSQAANEPLAIGGLNTLRDVYLYEPVPEVLTEEEAGYILGSQGNVWTEYIPSASHVEYMVFPRAIALAEVNWSSKENRNWEDFAARLSAHMPLLAEKEVNYSKSACNVDISTLCDEPSGSIRVTLSSGMPGGTILYNTGSETNTSWKRYKKPFTIKETTKVNAILRINKEFPGNTTSRTIIVHDASGIKPELLTRYSESYSACGSGSLTDGCRAHALSLGKDWLGFSGINAEFVLDLKEIKEIKNVNIGFLYNPANWIFLPTGVEIGLSVDGITYLPAGGIRPDLLTVREPVAIDYSQVAIDAKARFIRIKAINRGKCPDGHPGAGQDAWLFLDEVMVNYPLD